MSTSATATPSPIKEGFFLRRPVFSTVLSIFIVLMGIMALRVLPVSQYPDLVPPTVMVAAQYPGASPETIAQTVATPLEQQINGVDNMIYMNSVSSVSVPGAGGPDLPPPAGSADEKGAPAAASGATSGAASDQSAPAASGAAH